MLNNPHKYIDHTGKSASLAGGALLLGSAAVSPWLLAAGVCLFGVFVIAPIILGPSTGALSSSSMHTPSISDQLDYIDGADTNPNTITLNEERNDREQRDFKADKHRNGGTFY